RWTAARPLRPGRSHRPSPALDADRERPGPRVNRRRQVECPGPRVNRRRAERPGRPARAARPSRTRERLRRRRVRRVLPDLRGWRAGTGPGSDRGIARHAQVHGTTEVQELGESGLGPSWTTIIRNPVAGVARAAGRPSTSTVLALAPSAAAAAARTGPCGA